MQECKEIFLRKKILLKIFYSLLSPCCLLFTLYCSLLLFFPSLSSGYDRIISLSPQITESIYLLGAEDKLIGVTTLCKRPEEATLKAKIGTPLRPDIEKIVSMKPDLILGTREGNPPIVMSKLKTFDLYTYYFSRPKNLDDLLTNFITIAQFVDKEEEGRRIVETVRYALHRMKRESPLRVLWQVGANPLIVASKMSFANDIIKLAGGINVIETDVPYPRVSIEEVVAKKPQVIVLMDMGYPVEQEMTKWKSCIDNIQFVIMDAYVVGSPTPLTFLEAVKRLVDKLNSTNMP
ncbi:MAG TPA: hypothetical protein DDW17_07605 [Deltaproteobacteria bacterium]|nr:hypothetical protein [Deltaproteobacteria bacterium]